MFIYIHMLLHTVKTSETSKSESRVSGQSENGSRSISGDKDEGELWTGSIEVKVNSECPITRY